MKNSPPQDLSKAARTWWRRIVNEHAIDDASGRLLLETALQAFDRMREAQALIAKHGAITKDRFGQLRPNPATVIERDARSAMLHALRALNLDIEPLRHAAGRPPGEI